LVEREQLLEKIRSEIKTMEDEKDAEIVHIKRQAENTIRNLKTL